MDNNQLEAVAIRRTDIRGLDGTETAPFRTRTDVFGKCEAGDRLYWYAPTRVEQACIRHAAQWWASRRLGGRVKCRKVPEQPDYYETWIVR